MPGRKQPPASHRGEWFEHTAELADFIEGVRDAMRAEIDGIRRDA